MKGSFIATLIKEGEQWRGVGKKRKGESNELECGQYIITLFALPFPSMAFQTVQWLRTRLTMQETWIWSLAGEDALEEGMATHSSIFAGRIAWTEEPGGLQSVGSQNNWTQLNDWACMHACTVPSKSCGSPAPSWRRKWAVPLPRYAARWQEEHPQTLHHRPIRFSRPCPMRWFVLGGPEWACASAMDELGLQGCSVSFPRTPGWRQEGQSGPQLSSGERQRACSLSRGTVPASRELPLQTHVSPWSESLCLKGCLTFLFLVKEKGARGIRAGRRKRGQEEGLMSEHGWQHAPRASPRSRVHVEPQSITWKDTPQEDLRLKVRLALCYIRPGPGFPGPGARTCHLICRGSLQNEYVSLLFRRRETSVITTLWNSTPLFFRGLSMGHSTFSLLFHTMLSEPRGTCGVNISPCTGGLIRWCPGSGVVMSSQAPPLLTRPQPQPTRAGGDLQGYCGLCSRTHEALESG